MYILCDTCSILMLIRIAPEMFNDPKFACKTIAEVRNEFVSTTRFKEKYPWRKDFISKVKSVKLAEQSDIEISLELIKRISENIKNQRTNRFYSLSRVDKQISAQIVNFLDANISTGDQDLIDFLEQEFEIKNVYPLDIIVKWLQSDLIKWNSEIEKILEDWNDKNEKAQPLSAKHNLKKITGYIYSGLTFND